MSKKRKIYLHYSEDGEADAVADTMQELADQVGVGLSAVSKGLKNGSDLYGVVDDDEETESYIEKHSDWAKVVRCRDCIYYMLSSGNPYCQMLDCRVSDDWFCASGAREDDP